MASRVPMSQFFHNAEGIDREVITTEVPRFLGRDATVRPATMGGRSGFLITAFRDLTTAQLEDIKQVSARYLREAHTTRGQGRGSVPYVQSDTLRGRGDPQPPAAGGYPPTDYYAAAGRTETQGRAYAGAGTGYSYDNRGQAQAYGGDGNYVPSAAPQGSTGWAPPAGTNYDQYGAPGYDPRGAAGVPRNYDEGTGYGRRGDGGNNAPGATPQGNNYPVDPRSYYDPRTGQPYIDPRTGVPYTDPRTGQPYRAA